MTLSISSIDAYGASYSLARSILPVLDTVFTPRYYVPGELTPRSSEGHENRGMARMEPKIYPNPTFKSFFVDIPEHYPSLSQLELFDLNGRIVHSTKLYHGTNTINPVGSKDQLSGIFIYRIYSEDSMLFAGRVLIIQE